MISVRLTFTKHGRKIFVRNACSIREINYLPLDYQPVTYESEKYVHLVIVGMSRMGIALER